MRYWIFCLLFAQSVDSFANIKVDDILPKEQIDEILKTDNFFGKNEFQEGKAPWEPFEQVYSEVFLKGRTQKVDYEEAIDFTMRSSFALSYGMEQLARAELSKHEALGKLLPSINLTVGDGTPIGAKEAFSGLFSFLMPHNWIKLRNQRKHIDVAKENIRKAALDDYLNIHLVFLDLHRVVLNLEIMSFYLSHLQLLERSSVTIMDIDRELIESIQTMVGVDLAEAKWRVGIHHNNLAETMSVIQDAKKLFSAGSLRIDLIKNFPDDLKPVQELGADYISKEHFVQTAMNRSIELTIVKIISDIAKKRVGIRALGDVFHDNSEGTEIKIGFNFGYDNIPRTLISLSEYRTTQIDVYRELLELLDIARRSYGNYLGVFASFQEAKNSVKVNRRLFYELLEDVVTKESCSDALKFTTYLHNLIKAEIIKNNTLHNGLRMHAIARRYLLEDEPLIQDYLPTDFDIDAGIDKSRNGRLYRKMQTLDEYLRVIKKPKELKAFLNDQIKRAIWYGYGRRTTKEIVTNNVGLLLHPEHRSRKFFRILKKYLEKEKIPLCECQKKLLDFSLKNSRFSRHLKRETRPDYICNCNSKKKKTSPLP